MKDTTAFAAKYSNKVNTVSKFEFTDSLGNKHTKENGIEFKYEIGWRFTSNA